MTTKNSNGEYSKPIVQKPQKEIIKEQVEKVNEEQVKDSSINPKITETKPVAPKVTETKSVNPEVIKTKPVAPKVTETKLFVEEEPEKIVEVLENSHNIDAVAEIEKVMHAEMGGISYGLDAQAELNKTLENAGAEIEFDEAPKPEKKVELVKGNKLTEKLKEVSKKIEEFQTIQVVPTLPEPEPESMYTLTKKQEEVGAQAVADIVNNQIIEELKVSGYIPKENVTEKIEGEYLLTKEQEEEGAQAVADMVNKQILKELKELRALISKRPKVVKLGSLNQREVRYFKRTGQMPSKI